MPATEAYTGEADGVPIGALTPGGAAEKAGLEEGDCLVTWNGKPIDDIRAWMRMLVQQKPGNEVKVGILRGKKKLEKTVELQGRWGVANPGSSAPSPARPPQGPGQPGPRPDAGPVAWTLSQGLVKVRQVVCL